MQPWKISAGLTAALAGSTVLLAGSRLEYLAPFWPLILADHGVAIVLHLALGLTAVAAAIYAVARAAGLADLAIHISLITIDPDLIRCFEARSPMPHVRLRALSRLTAANVNAGLIVAPILPGISDSVTQFTELIQAAKAAPPVRRNPQGVHRAPRA